MDARKLIELEFKNEQTNKETKDILFQVNLLINHARQIKSRLKRIIAIQQFVNGDISTMSKGKMIAHFEWQDYTDPLGHKLILNVDFINLIDRAIEKETAKSE